MIDSAPMADGLGARAELEVNAGPLGEFDLAAVVDLFGDRMRHELAESRAESVKRGRYHTIFGAGQIPAGGAPAGGAAMSANPASPPTGRLWLLQWVAIFPTQAPFVAVANLAAIICVGRAPVGPGGAMPSAINVNPSDIVVPAVALPAAVNVPDKTVVTSRHNLYVVMSGAGLGPAGTNYMFTAGVLDVEDREEVYFW